MTKFQSLVFRIYIFVYRFPSILKVKTFIHFQNSLSCIHKTLISTENF
jgi:hypothetical protein